MTAAVLIERDGAIATVVLNAPDRLNALSLASWTELGARMRELSADDALRCVIVRKVVDAHGGQVSVDASPEHGTTFTVVLPRRP
jgi:enoyl-CoA hydratase/carnithine racemase